MSSYRVKTKYNALLEKYITYLIDVEGTDFISSHDNRYMSGVKSTEEEWKILEKISEKVKG